MNVSCVIVSYNNGELLHEAILSVVRQSRQPAEIIVADDASTDGSRERIEALARDHPIIRPIFRERNLGVAANRDLAIRDARGEFVTYLDGDDHFLPGKLEAEIRALGGRNDVIAYSDVLWVDRTTNRRRFMSNAKFANHEASARFRWLLDTRKQSPAAMLTPKEAYLTAGGYRHTLRTYEDWDYTLRLAALPLNWTHSEIVGLVAHPAGGLSRQGPLEHLRDQLHVLYLNEALIRRHVGLTFFFAKTARLAASRTKAQVLRVYSRRRWR